MSFASMSCMSTCIRLIHEQFMFFHFFIYFLFYFCIFSLDAIHGYSGHVHIRYDQIRITLDLYVVVTAFTQYVDPTQDINSYRMDAMSSRFQRLPRDYICLSLTCNSSSVGYFACLARCSNSRIFLVLLAKCESGSQVESSYR